MRFTKAICWQTGDNDGEKVISNNNNEEQAVIKSKKRKKGSTLRYMLPLYADFLWASIFGRHRMTAKQRAPSENKEP